MESDLWWTRVKIDPFQKRLLRWVIDIGGTAGAGEIMPDVGTDPEGYGQWAESYLSVEASLHVNLRGMLEVVLADPRYIALGEFGRILHRVKVIRQVYADYGFSTMFLDDDDEDLPNSLKTVAQVPDVSLSSSDPANNHQQPAPTFSTGPTARTGRLTPSSYIQSTNRFAHLPSAAPFDRVYRATSRFNQQTRRLRCKAILEPNLWGARCAICGCTASPDNGGHRTYACARLTFAAQSQETVLVKLVKRPQALMVDAGEKRGLRICYEWNNRRTKDGRCYEKDCKAKHCCSLCFNNDHRAWDCDARAYLPKLPPRPKSMVPARVEECWRMYNGTK